MFNCRPKHPLLAKAPRPPSKRDIIESKQSRGSNRKMIPSRKGSSKKLERKSSRKSLSRKPSQGYLSKYNSRNSREKKRSTSSRRRDSYDSNISFNREKSAGQSSKKSSSRSKKNATKKKLNPVRPPARRKSIDRGSGQKQGSSRRQSRERGGSNYYSNVQPRVKSNRGVPYPDK